MPFKFSYLCDLLQKLESPYLRGTLVLEGPVREFTQKETISWFQTYKNKLNEFAVGSTAVATMLRPKAWTDRDFGLDADGLEHVLARVLEVTVVQHAELGRWKCEGWKGDLGVCVERVMRRANIMIQISERNAVTVEELDTVLLKIASPNKNSSPEIQALSSTLPRSFCAIEALKDIYTRLEPHEAKWLTRIILKTTSPVQIPAEFHVASFHASLPNVLKVNVGLPRSAPVTITIGTGKWTGPSYTRKRRASTPPRDDGRIDSRTRRASPGPIVFKRGPLRSIGSTAIVNNPMPTPPTSALEKSKLMRRSPKLGSPPRQLSRRTSPGNISFQKGVLKSRDPEVARRNQMMSSTSIHAPTASLPTPPISTTPSTSSVTVPPRRSSINTPANHPVFKLGLLTPNTTPLPTHTTSNPTPPTPVNVPIPTPTNPTPLTNPRTPCILTPHGHCSLRNILFILAPSLPPSLPPLLTTHNALYTTSPSHLTHPSLPLLYPITKRKYRRIALVDTYDAKGTGEFLREIQSLSGSGKGGKGVNGKERGRDWVEVFDWRLVGLVGREERSENGGSGKGKGKARDRNIWRRCWVCAI